MKKLVLSVLAIGLFMPVLTASARYYDCNWQIHEGDPPPSECYMFVSPDDARSTNTLSTSGSSGRTSDNSTNTLSTSGSSGRTLDNSTNNLSTSGTSGRTSNNNVNVLTPSGSASDLRAESTKDDNAPATDPNDFYKEYYKKNVRDYCVRDVCYVLYDYCYDETHCEAKKDVENRNEYDPQYDPTNPDYSRNRYNTWNYWINYYVNNYTNNYYIGMPACDSRYQKCVYRGYHFGGYHNGYLPANGQY